MKQKKNAQWTEARARQLLAHAEEHGLSVPELAREHSVSPQRIYWWGDIGRELRQGIEHRRHFLGPQMVLAAPGPGQAQPGRAGLE